MCGIAGFISKNAIESQSITDMADCISYRGPDSRGYLLLESFSETPCLDVSLKHATLAMAHLRLSIVDLSPLGHQPMCYQDRYWITYNGEIYNYIELREELIKLGHAFSSNSDTEVILVAYAQWGIECLSRFNGMWAFAIYDQQEQTIFLARDRFGVKPLYYWISPDKVFYFASEIKQFSVLPGWEARMNKARAVDFLNNGLIDHTDETLFGGVYSLPGGCFLQAKVPFENISSGQRVDFNRWYALPLNKFDGTFEQAADKLQVFLEDSVRLRLRADVPVGSCLSGGLDSSSIVCVMNDQLKQANAQELQKTFSACSSSKKLDEKKWVDIVVRERHVDAHYTYPDMDQMFSHLSDILWHQDEPFGSTSIFAQWAVCKLAADNDVRVLLDGQGADEHLGGYHQFHGVRLASLLLSFHWKTLAKEIYQTHSIHGYPYWKLLGHMVIALMNGGNMLALSVSQLTSTNLGMLLHWEDRNSMAHSIEARVPFLDYRLVEFVLSLPDSYKISEGITKRVLRKAMDGILPTAIRDRQDKIGFATAEEDWIRGAGADLARQAIANVIAQDHELVPKKTLKRLENVISGKERFGFDLWRAIAFGAWVDLFQVQSSR